MQVNAPPTLAPIVILISGLSCSGKSTLARKLAAALDGEVIRVDDYYFETDPTEFANTDFDDPAMIDVALLADHLKQLKCGVTIHSPHYDFTECRYTRYRTIHPKPHLIVEGQFAATYQPVLQLADQRIYLDVPFETCLARRLIRDQTILHRTKADSEARFQTKVAPAFEKHRQTLIQNSTQILTPAPQSHWLTQVMASLLRSG